MNDTSATEYRMNPAENKTLSVDEFEAAPVRKRRQRRREGVDMSATWRVWSVSEGTLPFAVDEGTEGDCKSGAARRNDTLGALGITGARFEARPANWRDAPEQEAPAAILHRLTAKA